LRAFAQPVDAAPDALGRILRRRRMRIVFVGDGDVVEDVLLRLKHAARAVLDDGSELVGEARVVSAAVGDRAGGEMRGAVLMLQAFSRERRTTGGAADEKPARTRVG